MAKRHNVQHMRDAMGLSTDEFAERLGVAERTIRRWESGEFNPSPMAMAHMRRVWGVFQRDRALTEKPETTMTTTSSPAADAPRRVAVAPAPALAAATAADA